MTTKAEALNKLNEIKRNSQHNGYMWASDVEELFYKIYDEHEAQMKAKDEEIERLKKQLCDSIFKSKTYHTDNSNTQDLLHMPTGFVLQKGPYFDKYRIKPQQVVVMEKWLVKTVFDSGFKVIEASVDFFESHFPDEDKIKLLETYKVEL